MRLSHSRILGHHQHVGEETVDRRVQLAQHLAKRANAAFSLPFAICHLPGFVEPPGRIFGVVFRRQGIDLRQGSHDALASCVGREDVRPVGGFHQLGQLARGRGRTGGIMALLGQDGGDHVMRQPLVAQPAVQSIPDEHQHIAEYGIRDGHWQ